MVVLSGRHLGFLSSRPLNLSDSRYCCHPLAMFSQILDLSYPCHLRHPHPQIFVILIVLSNSRSLGFSSLVSSSCSLATIMRCNLPSVSVVLTCILVKVLYYLGPLLSIAKFQYFILG